MKDEFNISTCRILKSYSNDFKCDKNVNGMSDLKVELFNDKKSNNESIDSFQDKIIFPKTIKEIFENKDKYLKYEFDNIKPTIETPLLYKGPNNNQYKKYHLSFNNIYFVLYKEKRQINDKDLFIKKTSTEFINESGINLRLKKKYDIYHPIFCLNFNLVTSFLTTNENSKEIIINILSNKIISFYLKPINKDYNLYLNLLSILQSSIVNSRGYHYNLLGVSLLKDFYTNYYMKVAQFEYKAKTGDLLLFRGFDCPSTIQRCYTKNKYDHVALISKKNGILYVYEATSKEGCKRRQWIQFKAYLWNLLYEKMVYRELIIKVDNEEIKDNIINELNNKVEEYVKITQGKKYKMYLFSIICGSKQTETQKNNLWNNKPGFICSSLVMGAYLQMGLCQYKKNVNEILPGYFSQEGDLELNPQFELGPEVILDFSE